MEHTWLVLPRPVRGERDYLPYNPCDCDKEKFSNLPNKRKSVSVCESEGEGRVCMSLYARQVGGLTKDFGMAAGRLTHLNWSTVRERERVCVLEGATATEIL